jgi:hypothetical protein
MSPIEDRRNGAPTAKQTAPFPDPTKGASIMTASPLTVHVCGDCAGTLRVIDADGTLTGLTGAVVPCRCTDAGNGARCACWVYEWPENDGFTGWIPWAPPLFPEDEYDDEEPSFTPCPVHAPRRAALVASSALAVAA